MSGTREWEKEAIVKEVYELSYRNMPDLRVSLVTPTSSKISLQSFTRQIMFSTKIQTILTLKSVFVSLMPISSQYYAERPSQICNIFLNMVLISLPSLSPQKISLLYSFIFLTCICQLTNPSHKSHLSRPFEKCHKNIGARRLPLLGIKGSFRGKPLSYSLYIMSSNFIRHNSWLLGQFSTSSPQLLVLNPDAIQKCQVDGKMRNCSIWISLC